MRNGRVFGYVELGGGIGIGTGLCDVMTLVYGLVVARELVWVSAISTRYMGMPQKRREVLTFDRVGVTIWLEAVPLSRAILALQFLPEFVVLFLVVPPPPKVLVVIEDGGTYSLLCPFLAHDVLVDAGLEIAGIELWDSKGRVGEHGPAVGDIGGVIRTGEARVQAVRSSRGSGRRGHREGPISRARALRRRLQMGGAWGWGFSAGVRQWQQSQFRPRHDVLRLHNMLRGTRD